MCEYEWNIVFSLNGGDISYSLYTDTDDSEIAISHAIADMRGSGINFGSASSVAATRIG